MAEHGLRSASGQPGLLVCLPFAGAHMDPFRAVTAGLRAVESLTAVSHSYPGHGVRIREGLLPSIEEMADDCVSTVLDTSPAAETVSLLGYSMGSLVAVEAARRLDALGRRVDRVIAMAATPPHRLDPAPVDVATDEALLSHCEQYGLVEDGAFASPQVRELFLPALRNDIRAVAAYARARRGVVTLPEAARLTTFSGALDRSVRDQDGWSDMTGGPVRRSVHPGGHFFIRSDEWTVVDAVVRLFTPPDDHAGAADAIGRTEEELDDATR